MSDSEDQIASILWRLALAGLAAVIGVMLVGALLLAGGAADPALPGPLIWAEDAAPGACLDRASLQLPPVNVPMLIEAAATSADHGAWGVALDGGDEAQRWEIVPPGYVRYAGQTWPFHHVREDRNSLRLELLSPLDGGPGVHWRLWINLERAAEGDLPLLVETSSLLDEPGICWEQLRVYGPA